MFWRTRLALQYRTSASPPPACCCCSNCCSCSITNPVSNSSKKRRSSAPASSLSPGRPQDKDEHRIRRRLSLSSHPETMTDISLSSISLVRPATSIHSLPDELLLQIFIHLSSTKTSADIPALRTACLVSQRFHRCAQGCPIRSAACILNVSTPPASTVKQDSRISEIDNQTNAPLADEDRVPEEEKKASRTLLLIRTLLAQPRLAAQLRALEIDLTAPVSGDVFQRTVTVGYLKKVFGKEGTKAVLRAWRDGTPATTIKDAKERRTEVKRTKRDMFAFQMTRFPVAVILDLIHESATRPLAAILNVKESTALVQRVYALEQHVVSLSGLSSRLLRGLWSDDAVSCSLLLWALSSARTTDLRVVTGDYGTRMAGSLLQAGAMALGGLKRLAVKQTGGRPWAQGLEVQLLRLVSGVQEVEVELEGSGTVEDAAALRDMEGKCRARRLVVKGDMQGEYLEALMKCFRKLEEVVFEHSPARGRLGLPHHQHPQHHHYHSHGDDVDTASIVLSAMEVHKTTLRKLKIRCAKWCSTCNLPDARLDHLSALTHLDVDARLLGFPSPFDDPVQNGSTHAISRLPPSLKSLALSYIPCFCGRGVEMSVLRTLGRFVKDLKGREPSPKCVMPALRRLTLERMCYEEAERERFMGNAGLLTGGIFPNSYRWGVCWACEVAETQAIKEGCADVGVEFVYYKFGRGDQGLALMKTV